MTHPTLDLVLDQLQQSRQRATYGAVAALVGATPRTLMRGRERDQRHSWVVNRSSGRPTGYADNQVHPELEHSPHLIDSREELATWLESQSALSTT